MILPPWIIGGGLENNTHNQLGRMSKNKCPSRYFGLAAYRYPLPTSEESVNHRGENVDPGDPNHNPLRILIPLRVGIALLICG